MAQLKLNIETLFPQFQIVTIVRQNTFKKTIIVRRNGHKYILRLFNLNGMHKDRVQSIIKLLNKISKLKNPHVLKFYEATFDQEMTYLGIISEYVENQYQCPMPEISIWSLIQQISSALSLFHPKRVHGKILISNIFHSEDITILGEMNVLYYLHQQTYQDIYLLAPEFIKNQIYDTRSDIWMFGYLIYQLMFKDPPFVANNINILHKKILKGFQVPFNPNYSLNLNNLLRLMLCYDVDLRPTIDQVLNFAEMAEVSTEEININKILPQFKLEKVVLHKKRQQKIDKPVHNIVYLDSDLYRKPYFPPSKVIKSKPKSPETIGKKIFSIFDLTPQEKTGYSLQLPRVLQNQYSKIKIKSETRKDTPVRLLEETQRMLEGFQPMAKYFQLPKRVSIQQQPKKNLTKQLFQPSSNPLMQKNLSQKTFQYN